MVNRRQVILAPMAYFAAAAEGGTGILPGSCKVSGDLSKLLHKGKPAGFLRGKTLLVYFTTAHRVPACSSDLPDIADAAGMVNESIGAGTVYPVAVYPEPDRPDRSNLTGYIEKTESPFIGLTGPKEQILGTARGYAASYAPDLSAHTRFVYLMNPQGRNIGIFPASGINLPQIVREIVSVLKKEGNLPACTP